MLRKIILIIVLLAGLTLEAGAVLKEKNLDETLSILHQELTKQDAELSSKAEMRTKQRKFIFQRLITAMKQADQNSLMLYSQQSDYVFDLTYACHEATEQYRNFHQRQLPFKKFIQKSKSDIARYDSLTKSLEAMPDRVLSKQGQQERTVCLALAKSIREKLVKEEQSMQEYIRVYSRTEQRLRHLNDYAQERYTDLQTSIFRNGSDTYWEILTNFQMKWHFMMRSIERKYNFSDARSQWSGQWIVGTFIAILFYILLAIVLNQLFFRFLMPKRFDTEEFRKKRACIIMATTTVTFAIIQGLVINNTSQNFLIMASELLVEYAWLLGVILVSLLLRVSGEQIGYAFKIYSPLLTLGFIVIVFRIILIPSELVNIIFPPILMLCALWQWFFIKRHHKRVPRSDMMYSYFSLAVFITSVCCSSAGYTLFSVQLLIWWIMQLTCVLTITCISQYIRLYATKHGLEDKHIDKTWFYHLLEQVFMPVLSVLSILISIFWSAKVFNLDSLCWKVFNYLFIDMENLQVSILKLAIVICLWFLFRYITQTILALMRLHYQQTDPASAASREVMGKNVIQVLVWGIWLMISLSYLHISVSWLLAIGGGLSTGIGFASKDIIENIYYGASLMAGRIKVGDWIQVDGTMGKISSISYTSTVVESLYGEIITFQNSQLFAKNYKNLTRNHGYILTLVPFGVAYGSKVGQVKELVEQAVKQLKHKWMDNRKEPKVVMTEMADSSVNFQLIIWVDAVKKIYVVSDINQCIYDTLNQNGIEIPFPQRDVHLKS
ncbi:MAG: mechanosensitive ion channel family protein [Prevotella sp.]|nr:mechanosensitive ion channel family protein [Prevotella sp.]